MRARASDPQNTSARGARIRRRGSAGGSRRACETTVSLDRGGWAGRRPQSDRPAAPLRGTRLMREVCFRSPGLSWVKDDEFETVEDGPQSPRTHRRGDRRRAWVRGSLRGARDQLEDVRAWNADLTAAMAARAHARLAEEPATVEAARTARAVEEALRQAPEQIVEHLRQRTADARLDQHGPAAPDRRARGGREQARIRQRAAPAGNSPSASDSSTEARQRGAAGSAGALRERVRQRARSAWRSSPWMIAGCRSTMRSAGSPATPRRQLKATTLRAMTHPGRHRSRRAEPGAAPGRPDPQLPGREALPPRLGPSCLGAGDHVDRPR